VAQSVAIADIWEGIS